MTLLQSRKQGNGTNEGASSISVPGEAPIFNSTPINNFSEISNDEFGQSSFTPFTIKGKRIYNVIDKLPSGNEGHASVSYVAESDEKKFVIKSKSVGLGQTIGTLYSRTKSLSDAVSNSTHPLTIKDEELITNTRDVITVRPFIEGRNLDDIVRQTPLSEQEARRMIFSIAGQLQSVHDNNVIHLDVKPKNIIKDTDGNYRLIDFGIAKVKSDRDFADQIRDATTMTPRGTAGYMAPETYDAIAAYNQSDIYSLAHTIIFALGGGNPEIGFDKKSHDSVSSRINKMNISKEMKATLIKASNIDYTKRHSSAREFSDSLVAIVEHSSAKQEYSNISQGALREINSRLEKYNIPEDLKSDIGKLETIFKEEYKSFVSGRKPLDKNFLNDLDTTLKRLGYQHNIKNNFYFRERKEDTTVDVLFLDNKDKYFKFHNFSSEKLQSVYDGQNKKELEESTNNLIESAGNIVGLSAGITAFVAPIAYATANYGSAGFVGTAIVGTGIQAFATVMLGLLFDLDVKPHGFASYHAGVAASNITEAVLKPSIKSFISFGEYLRTETKGSALRLALKPAPGFTYEITVNIDSSKTKENVTTPTYSGGGAKYT